MQINGRICNTLMGCDGVPEAFGNPRNSRFDATTYSKAKVVKLTAPPPAPPATFDWLPPVDSSGAVPEPASRLMLITGFDLAGVALWRQRATKAWPSPSCAW